MVIPLRTHLLWPLHSDDRLSFRLLVVFNLVVFNQPRCTFIKLHFSPSLIMTCLCKISAWLVGVVAILSCFSILAGQFGSFPKGRTFYILLWPLHSDDRLSFRLLVVFNLVVLNQPTCRFIKLHFSSSLTMTCGNDLQDFKMTCNRVNWCEPYWVLFSSGQGSSGQSIVRCLEGLGWLEDGYSLKDAPFMTSAFWWQAELQAAGHLQSGSLQSAEASSGCRNC